MIRKLRDLFLIYNDGNISKDVSLYLACVNYYMQMHEDAEIAVSNGSGGCLKNRILFHVTLKKSEYDGQANVLHL